MGEDGCCGGLADARAAGIDIQRIALDDDLRGSTPGLTTPLEGNAGPAGGTTTRCATIRELISANRRPAALVDHAICEIRLGNDVMAQGHIGTVTTDNGPGVDAIAAVGPGEDTRDIPKNIIAHDPVQVVEQIQPGALHPDNDIILPDVATAGGPTLVVVAGQRIPGVAGRAITQFRGDIIPSGKSISRIIIKNPKVRPSTLRTVVEHSQARASRTGAAPDPNIHAA